jgi:hypothetical protein
MVSYDRQPATPSRVWGRVIRRTRIFPKAHAKPSSQLLPRRGAPLIRSRLLWVLADVVGLFSVNVGALSRNLGRRGRIFSANLGLDRPMLLGRATYVLGSLHLVGRAVRIPALTARKTLLAAPPPCRGAASILGPRLTPTYRRRPAVPELGNLFVMCDAESVQMEPYSSSILDREAPIMRIALSFWLAASLTFTCAISADEWVKHDAGRDDYVRDRTACAHDAQMMALLRLA